MLAIPDSIQPVIDRQTTPTDILGGEEELAEVPPDSPEWYQVQALQPGNWLEFTLDDEAPARAKLSWISPVRSEEHTSELQSLMRISYAVFCLKKNKNHTVKDYN